MGELFNQTQSTMLWYEPQDHYYAAYYGTPVYTVDAKLIAYPNGSQRFAHLIVMETNAMSWRFLLLVIFHKPHNCIN